jgi:hypothetical protein
MSRQRVTGDVTAQLPLRVLDLSRGGADLILNAAVSPGTVHEFTIDLAGVPFLARGRVCRCVPREKTFEVAVEFVDLTPRDQMRLEQYLSVRIPRQGA